MTIFMTGYKFKPTHSDIHYVTAHTLASLSADPNTYAFSTDIAHAMQFNNESDATRAIYTAIANFSESDDYEWTPVLVDVNGVETGNIRPTFRVGTQQFRDQNLPYFLSR